MSNWETQTTEWKRWYPRDDVFKIRASVIMDKGLPCAISVNHKKEDWGRITLVLTPLAGRFKQAAEYRLVIWSASSIT
jgi:hypothetical protein